MRSMHQDDSGNATSASSLSMQASSIDMSKVTMSMKLSHFQCLCSSMANSLCLLYIHLLVFEVLYQDQNKLSTNFQLISSNHH